ncbi:hypothetical protein LTR64_004076 [Lithohypha guttulata]|uniref:uncharacterized protein n=1 Tax=Lithohypha guttulata TaxID=1690604 RepID=UPI002DE19FF0|nr:hypothetical protein LTR51_006631 [Lithohypha guttulata]
MSQRSKHGRLPPRPSEQTRCDPDIRAVLKTLIVDGKLAGRELSQEKDVAQAQLEKAFAAYLEQVPDIEKRVKNKIEDMKEMMGIMGAIKFEKMEDIKEVLKDHNWHTFRPSDSDEPYYRAMCLRKDGVLLVCWSTLFTSPLTDMKTRDAAQQKSPGKLLALPQEEDDSKKLLNKKPLRLVCPVLSEKLSDTRGGG